MLGTIGLVILLVACLASAFSLIFRLRGEALKNANSSSGSSTLPSYR
jgi:hypothetical protein